MSAESADLLTFIQFVLAFTVARLIDEHLLRPLGRLAADWWRQWWGVWREFWRDFKSLWWDKEGN